MDFSEHKKNNPPSKKKKKKETERDRESRGGERGEQGRCGEGRGRFPRDFECSAVEFAPDFAQPQRALTVGIPGPRSTWRGWRLWGDREAGSRSVSAEDAWLMRPSLQAFSAAGHRQVIVPSSRARVRHPRGVWE